MEKVLVLSLVSGFLVASSAIVDEARADTAVKLPYRYVSLDAAIPSGYLLFDPRSITDGGDIYGNLFQCGAETCTSFVAVYRNDKITPLHAGFANDANARGVVGGSVERDPDLFTTQAALFRGSEVELIPPLPDEVSSEVLAVTNSNIAFVQSFDSSFNATYYLTRHGQVTPLNFGPDPAGFFDINDRGVISGTSFRAGGARALRYDPFAGSFTLLDPLPTEPEAWGQAINNRGDVLGYSFVSGALERIGVWRDTRFRTSFVEGTPEFPTVSNRLLWNERGLVVITETTDSNSYLVPRPGVRLNLADLTAGPLPPWTLILDINNRGDLIGVGGDEPFNVNSVFLLRRGGPAGHHPVAASSAGAASALAEARESHAAALERFLHGLHGRSVTDETAPSKHLPRE